MNHKPSFDVDLDFYDRTGILEEIVHIPASITLPDGKVKKHPSGIYVQPIPVDPESELASIDYEKAENLGYFKLDFLNVEVYEDVRDRDHLRKLISEEPNWELMTYPEVVKSLFHLGNHWYLVKKFPPTSVEDISILIALIRPGKKHLQAKSWDDIKKEIWDQHEGYTFKRSHAVGYATIIKMQLNLISEKLEETN